MLSTAPTMPDFAWDVLIVAAAAGAASHGHELRRELERHGMRVKLDVVPAPSVSAPPAETSRHAAHAASCIGLIAVEGTIAYVAMPAPKPRGERPRFAKPGAPATDGI
jgi:hypothetical protein